MSKTDNPAKRRMTAKALLTVLALALVALAAGCRYDMQDQPRMKPYKKSEFYPDGKAMRDAPEGTVARGDLQEDKEFFTGKKADADPNVAVETTTDAMGNTIVSSFPNAVEELPVPLTKELLDNGEKQYKIFCMVCHGPVGKGDGMVVRRGYPQPTTYHDDRLRNAPVGHFFDVITNGWGKMNGYSSQIPVADRWAIVAYIRALQLSQNPNPESGPVDGNESDSNSSENQNEQGQTSESEQQPGGDDGGESK